METEDYNNLVLQNGPSCPQLRDLVKRGDHCQNDGVSVANSHSLGEIMVANVQATSGLFSLISQQGRDLFENLCCLAKWLKEIRDVLVEMRDAQAAPSADYEVGAAALTLCGTDGNIYQRLLLPEYADGVLIGVKVKYIYCDGTAHDDIPDGVCLHLCQEKPSQGFLVRDVCLPGGGNGYQFYLAKECGESQVLATYNEDGTPAASDVAGNCC